MPIGSEYNVVHESCGVPISQLRDAAIALHRGGVGYYRASDFVHLDVGRVRYW